MAPKAATTKKSAAASTHGSYQDMIKDAIIKLKERNGSSRQAIKKYIKANNNLGSTTDNAFSSHISKALKTGVDNGVFAQPKGASGPVKLNKPGSGEKKPAAAKTAKPKTEKKDGATKKPATKKAPSAAKKATTATTKKAPAAKKAAAPKKPAAPKTATKKAAKPKAAPAVEEKKPEVLGKTKTGRVVKTTKPQTAKAVAPKKAAAAKKATPKKSTPKKA